MSLKPYGIEAQVSCFYSFSISCILMQRNPVKIVKFENLSKISVNINGLDISVEYKPIKNMHLAVYLENPL